MDNKESINSPDAGVDPYAIPADFPRPVHLGAVGGAQPKYLMVEFQGRYYSPGCTPPELRERWEACEDLVQQLATKSLESKAGKRSHMSEVEILDQYLPRLIQTRWTSQPEAHWVMRRVAAIIDWPVPPSCEEPHNPGTK